MSGVRVVLMVATWSTCGNGSHTKDNVLRDADTCVNTLDVKKSI